MANQTTAEALIEDRNGEMHVFLSPDGDHIVTKFIVSPRGRYEVMLPHGEWAWDRAVARAQIAVAFL